MRDRSTGQWRAKKRPGRPSKSTTRPGSGRKRTGSKPALRTAPRSAAPLAAVEDAPEQQEQPNPEHDPAAAWQEQPGEAPVEQRDDLGAAAATAMRNDVRALIALVYSLPADSLATIDPYCFGPLQDEPTAVGVVDSLTEIVMGSPKIATWVTSATGLMPWIKLGAALKPVAVNAWRHHVTHSVEVTVDRDAMTYSVERRDYSAYPAA